MLAVGATLTGLLILIAGVLAVPVVLMIDAQRADTVEARWQMRWLFGLVNIRSSKSRPRQSAPTPARATRPADGSKKARRKRLRIGVAVLRTRGLLHRVVQLAVGLLRQAKLERLRVRTSFGFDDPADTGLVYGGLSPALVLARLRGWDVQCRPMFLESGLRGDVRATIRIRPLFVVATIIAFLVSPPVLRAALAAWRVRQ